MESTKKDTERYIRINITKNRKGYQAETTVSLRWTDDAIAYTATLNDLNREANALARLEIARREALDDFKAEVSL